MGVQEGQQDMEEISPPVVCNVAVDNALHSPLEAFHHGTPDVVILAGGKANGSGNEQTLERCCVHISSLVALHCQQWFLHVIKDGCHDAGHLQAALAGRRVRPGILGDDIHATE